MGRNYFNGLEGDEKAFWASKEPGSLWANARRWRNGKGIWYLAKAIWYRHIVLILLCGGWFALGVAMGYTLGTIGR